MGVLGHAHLGGSHRVLFVVGKFEVFFLRYNGNKIRIRWCGLHDLVLGRPIAEAIDRVSSGKWTSGKRESRYIKLVTCYLKLVTNI